MTELVKSGGTSRHCPPNINRRPKVKINEDFKITDYGNPRSRHQSLEADGKEAGTVIEQKRST
jgi:hypothetical protein